LFDIAIERFDGYFTDQDGDEEQFVFRLAQLLDGQQFEVANELYVETCTLRFKNPRCGSTNGGQTFCTKKLIVVAPGPNDCSAVERFNGVPNPAPQSIYPNPVRTPGDNGDPDLRRRPPRDGGGRWKPNLL
jgi:hypothetical protein